MSNLYKQWGVAPKQEGARIINSNAIVAQKIEEMAKKDARAGWNRSGFYPMDSVRDLVQRTSKPFLRNHRQIQSRKQKKRQSVS